MQNTNHANKSIVNGLNKLYWIVIACIMAGCTNAPPLVKRPTEPPTQETVTKVAPAPVITAPKPERLASANNDKDYRKEAAQHLYIKNNSRIFPGKMPPMLYAVGVLEIDIDSMGMVSNIRWMRAPGHAPEVIAEIERSVRAAAPFPAPSHTNRVTYTDTWLWHKSGRFQLDTLTLGQL
jgi:protein TonB